MQTEVLIVDDETIAREGVRMLLENLPEIKIIGECENGIEAVDFIKRRKPDLIFLDVQMPGLDGFGVIEKIGVEQMPTVIFITAYDQYALRAFEVHAFDYLLKPFEDERFIQTLQRAISKLKGAGSENLSRRFIELLDDLRKCHQSLENSLKSGENRLERIVIKSGGRIFFLSADEVDWFEGADNYVKLHVGRERHLVRETLGSLEERLNPQHFLRIHRSIIVNIKFIKELHPLFNGVFSVILKDGTELTSGRSYRKNFNNLLDE